MIIRPSVKISEIACGTYRVEFFHDKKLAHKKIYQGISNTLLKTETWLFHNLYFLNLKKKTKIDL